MSAANGFKKAEASPSRDHANNPPFIVGEKHQQWRNENKNKNERSEWTFIFAVASFPWDHANNPLLLLVKINSIALRQDILCDLSGLLNK